MLLVASWEEISEPEVVVVVLVDVVGVDGLSSAPPGFVEPPSGGLEASAVDDAGWATAAGVAATSATSATSAVTTARRP